MRGCYMGEYQGNYEQNTSRKDDKINEMNMAIQAQVDYIKELKSFKEMKMEILRRLYATNAEKFLKRLVFS